MKIAIVGAGATGSLLAYLLTNKGHAVTVFEKSRGRGGRCCHKRANWGVFDTGAPVINASTSEFISFMRVLEQQGLACQWPIRIHEYKDQLRLKDSHSTYFTFTPGMNSACRYWLSDAKFVTQCRIEHLQKVNAGWLLWDDHERKFGAFEWVIVTTPLPQAIPLVNEQVEGGLVGQEWESCWTISLQFEQPVSINAEMIEFAKGPIKLIVHDSAKPGRRQTNDVWVAYFRHDLCADKSALDHSELQNLALQELHKLSRDELPAVIHRYQHYWRFAQLNLHQQAQGIFWDPVQRLASGGDWSYGASVQASFQCANMLFNKVQSESENPLVNTLVNNKLY